MSFNHQQMYKMEKLIQDASSVHKLIPWIKTEKDIINFMRRIPLDKIHLRKQLALHYFIKEKDARVLNNGQKIWNDAREIIDVLPEIPYTIIKERLCVLGNIPNRKEVVIRQLLIPRRELSTILTEIVSAKKRKTENIFDPDDNDDETNIKIKIRKIEGALKLVASIKQEKDSMRPAIDNSEKCQRFLEKLLTLSSKESQSLERDVRTLIQELIDDNKLEPEDFCDQLEKLLNASRQPCLVGFLRKSLPSLRHSLINQEVTIDGIRPPPTNVVVSLPGALPTVRPGTIPASQVRIVAPVTTVVQPGQIQQRVVAPVRDPVQQQQGTRMVTTIRQPVVNNVMVSTSQPSALHPMHPSGQQVVISGNTIRPPIQHILYSPSSEDESTSESSSSNSDISPARSSLINEHPRDISSGCQSKIPVQQVPDTHDVQTYNINNTSKNGDLYLSETEHTLMEAPINLNAPQFDLVSYLQEISQCPPSKIKDICKSLHVPLTERPTEIVLYNLLNKLISPGVIQLDDTLNSESSDSDEYYEEKTGYIGDPSCHYNDAEVVEGVEGSIDKVDANPVQAVANVEKPETNDLQVIADDTNARSNLPAQKFCLRPSALDADRNRSFIVSPKLTLPNSITPKPNNSDVMPALPQDVWNQTNIAIATLEEERQVVENGRTNENQWDASTSEDLEKKNKEVSTWLEAVPSTSKASVEQPVPVPSTSKELNSSTEQHVDENLFLRLVEIFPQACPVYLRGLCGGHLFSEFPAIVSLLLSYDAYPKRPERVPSPPKEVDFEDQFDMVKSLLPDADPQYLRMKCWDFANDIEGLNRFINDARENCDYPTMKEYLRKQQLSAQSKQYTTEFNVENFVELFPDPKNTFNDPKRIGKLDDYSQGYLNTFFGNRYDKLPIKTVKTILLRNNYRILASDKEMHRCMLANQVMKSRRKHTSLHGPGQNILFLQELAYFENKEEVEAFIKSKEVKAEDERQYAKNNGLMQTCQCCYEDEVMPKDTFECPKGCKFCSACIKKSCEIAFGEGVIDFKCLTECTEEFTLQTLQNVLPPKMFSKVAQKKALAEVKAAGIEELVTCPFCDFASIPAENDKIFRCLNPECMRESCLQCKEPNHLPLRCDEIEKDREVKARIFVENQMTEALLRKCWKCGTNFYKEEGCNKMTCTCGARMCYICRKPVKDYTHFNSTSCPLHTNTKRDNARAVLQAAKAAKAQVDPTSLKVDPAAGVKVRYKKRQGVLPREPHLQYDNMNGVQEQNHANQRMANRYQ